MASWPGSSGRRNADFGCNTETFTNSEMLEIETLGPTSRIEPGGFIDHDEIWQLQRGAATDSDADIDALING
jgi:hypothetical protein